MSAKWVEIVELKFEGNRFEGHSLTLDCLTELIDYQNLITQTAIELFKRDNPGWKRLPNNFQERTILRFNRIADGSAAVPLEALIDDGKQEELFVGNPLIEAIDLTGNTFESFRDKKAFPENLPKNVIPFFGKIGSSLRENERLRIKSINSKKIYEFTANDRKIVAEIYEKGYEDKIDIIGMVGAADVVHSTFNLYINDRRNYPVSFPIEAEETITTALKEHKFRRLRVRGIGEFTPDGMVKKITKLLSLEEVSNEERKQEEVPFIGDELLALIASVPDDELNKLPSDLAANHDKYLRSRPNK